MDDLYFYIKMDLKRLNIETRNLFMEQKHIDLTLSNQ